MMILCRTDSGLGPSVGIRNRGDSRHTAPSKGSFSARNRVFTVAPTTIEEDLRRTKILSSFMELRQEVQTEIISRNFSSISFTCKQETRTT